jgi:hypothetical protein
MGDASQKVDHPTLNAGLAESSSCDTWPAFNSSRVAGCGCGVASTSTRPEVWGFGEAARGFLTGGTGSLAVRAVIDGTSNLICARVESYWLRLPDSLVYRT